MTAPARAHTSRQLQGYAMVGGSFLTPVGHPMALPIIAPPPGYLEKVKELAHQNGAVLIFDEVRTGFRVAMGGAQQRYGVTPDVSAVGKAMANGYPIAAVVGKREILSVYETAAFLSSTFFPSSLEKSSVPVTMSGIPPMPFLTFDHVDDHYKQRRTEFYTQCIRRRLFVQPYHHWYIAYRYTEEDLRRGLEVVEEALAYVAEQYPWQR